LSQKPRFHTTYFYRFWLVLLSFIGIPLIMGNLLRIKLSALIPIMIFILIIIVSILAIGLVKPQVLSIPLIAIIVIMVALPGIFI